MMLDCGLYVRRTLRPALIVVTSIGLFSAPASQALVGTMEGSYAVSSGSASFTVPIQVSPGISGMQPSLSLSYSSQGGNGPLGVGWSLGGLSSIHRCNKNHR